MLYGEIFDILPLGGRYTSCYNTQNSTTVVSHNLFGKLFENKYETSIIKILRHKSEAISNHEAYQNIKNKTCKPQK